MVVDCDIIVYGTAAWKNTNKMLCGRSGAVGKRNILLPPYHREAVASWGKMILKSKWNRFLS